MADIFISYAREDETRIRELVRALEEQGWSIFWDRRIPAGKTWQGYIGRALSDAKCVIVAWSQHSITSDWVIEEANDAKDRGILIPILLDSVRPPLGFRGIQAADLTDRKPGYSSPRFDQLIQDIAGVVGGKPPQPAPEELVTPRTEPVATPMAIPTELPSHEPAPPKREPLKVRPRKPKAIKPESPEPEALQPKPVSKPAVKPPEPQVSQPKPAAEAPTQHAFTNSFGMSFALIPAGSFTMGSPADEPGRNDDERQHPVTISRPFCLQTTEVTQRQWKEVMGFQPSYFKDYGNDCPVETVSWNDAQEFIKKLNQMDSDAKYRLPTEAEWECACRAGSTEMYFFGDEETRLGEYVWNGGNSGGKTHPVGKKKPNALGLYDMHGNVWEWCQDWYGDYPSGQVTDPTGPKVGEKRVLRGGSWSNDAKYVRSASRNRYGPDYRNYGAGFRVARDP